MVSLPPKPPLQKATDGKMCPSSVMQEGAVLLGIVMPDGNIAYAKDRIEVDANFAAGASSGNPAEQRFRFSSPCMKGACKQWTNGGCGIIEAIVAEAPVKTVAHSLPLCSIRDDCRWFAQRGSKSCEVCPMVITDQRPHLQSRD